MLPADLASVSALGIRSKASWGYSPEEMSVFTKELTLSEQLLADSIVARVAVEDDQIMGYHTLKRSADSTLELDYIFVDPDHFHSGIGTTLLEDAMALARDLGFQSMILISDPNAVGFYQRFGAQIIGQHDSSIAGRQIPIMSLELTGRL